MQLYVHVEENVFEICEILLYYEIGSIAKIENENVFQNVINGKSNWRPYNRNSLTWSFKTYMEAHSQFQIFKLLTNFINLKQK